MSRARIRAPCPPCPDRQVAELPVEPRGRPGSGRALRLLATTGLAFLASTPRAAAALEIGDLVPTLDLHSTFGSAVVVGLVIFSTTLAILSVRERRRWSETESRLAAEVGRLQSAEDRAELLLGSERQVLVLWSGREADPTVEGDPSIVHEGASFRRVLAFGSWLVPADAGRLEAALGPLRERGEAFRMTIRAQAGSFIEAEGRTAAGRALLRLRDVAADRAACLRAEAEAARASDELSTLRGLLDAIEEPVWLRDGSGGLAWANRAYCTAVEAGSPAAVTTRALELLDRKERDASALCRSAGAPYRARVAAIVAGTRRVLDITEAPLAAGPDRPGSGQRAGGIARDVSDLETMRADLGRQTESHTRMLDQLPIAVATFDSGQRLVFHNAAYRQLWSLDAAFLESAPSDGEILDRLRAGRRLPEQADFRSWKAGLLQAYRGVEPAETWWHLPDRRTLRVVTSPNPQGGLTYLFDDVSDRMDLESRVNALIRTQTETLDTLAEGVALFGPNGRLKLHNRAFAELWRLSPDELASSPHIDAVVDLGRRLAAADGPWSDLRAAVSGLADMRERLATRIARFDGSMIDAAAEPLPDGATLLTFVDVTAQVNVERALTERNEALELAARLRNEFVHHVSYELRTPLTNIIGFAELLGAETVGALNERQREYAGHITRSSGSLLAIINDILDLASIDTDTIELAREPVDIEDTVRAAVLGIEDRLVDAKLKLAIDVPASIGSFAGDAKRVRQVLYNLLSNAAGFSRPGQTIRVAARRGEDFVAISVADQGRGIPEDVQGRIFDRFESHTAGSGHRGVGLGLSIVRSFVELHGGRVELVSERGAGTVVTCYFPTDGRPGQQLAASMPDDRRP